MHFKPTELASFHFITVDCILMSFSLMKASMVLKSLTLKVTLCSLFYLKVRNQWNPICWLDIVTFSQIIPYIIFSTVRFSVVFLIICFSYSSNIRTWSERKQSTFLHTHKSCNEICHFPVVTRLPLGVVMLQVSECLLYYYNVSRKELY